MKRLFGLLVFLIAFAALAFAQDSYTDHDETADRGARESKHQPFSHYMGLNLGMSAMRLNNGAILTADFGVSYDFYPFSWMSLNAGILLHQELKLADSSITEAPLCFTIPFGVHFNIPRADWLYTGLNFNINIPLADMKSPDDHGVYTKDDVFLSIPIDIGFDFIKAAGGGGRIFFRITPSFQRSGLVVPVGLMWQIYNWPIGPQKVEVNIPAPPVVIIIY